MVANSQSFGHPEAGRDMRRNFTTLSAFEHNGTPLALIPKTMKTLKNLGAAIVIGMAATVGFSGCAGDRYSQSTGEHIDDSATTSRVKSRLGDDGVYKYPDVKVTTFKGTVQLSGFVNQRAQKDRAGELAKNAPGVKDVVNNITVKE